MPAAYPEEDVISLITTEDSCIDAQDEFDVVEAELQTVDQSSDEYMTLSIEYQRLSGELGKCTTLLSEYNSQLVDSVESIIQKVP